MLRLQHNFFSKEVVSLIFFKKIISHTTF